MPKEEISLYIHIPFCLSKCTYCDFFSQPLACNNTNIPNLYITSLCNEILFRMQDFNDTLIKSIYIGGGSPSLLKGDQIKKISDCLKGFKLTKDCEFTFEVNPDDVSIELIAALEKAGVNRISCGIQSFNDEVLKKAKRRADSKSILKSLDLFDNYWNKKLSVDLICGLPFETEQSLLQGLELLVNKKIKHISFYSLCVEEETPLGKAIASGSQKYDFDFTDSLWLKGRDYLLEHDYNQYEVSNFCLTGNECRHNMTYWTHQSYLGFGSGGTGTVYDKALFNLKLQNKGDGIRYTNNQDIKEYIAFWSRPLEDICQNLSNIPQTVEKIIHKISVFEYFMMALRTNRGLSDAEYQKIFGEKIPQKIIEKLEAAASKRADGSYYMNKAQLLFLNKFLEDLID